MAKKIILEIEQTFSIYDSDNNLISKVKCVEDSDNAYVCRNCVFHKTNICDNMECDGYIRPDGLDVHFEYITL